MAWKALQVKRRFYGSVSVRLIRVGRTRARDSFQAGQSRQAMKSFRTPSETCSTREHRQKMTALVSGVLSPGQ